MNHIFKLLTEEESKILKEIGEGNIKPFPWSGQIVPVQQKHFLSTFIAPDLDRLEAHPDETLPMVYVLFERGEQEGHYEVGYSLDGEEIQKFKSSANYYLKVMSTVLKVIEKFVKEHDPDRLTVRGVDKQDVTVPGQKNRIYFAFVEKNAKRLGYEYGHGPNKIVLFKETEKSW